MRDLQGNATGPRSSSRRWLDVIKMLYPHLYWVMPGKSMQKMV